jgi:malate dehydrogenase (oxaloacetate-decarboxylating)(NADP+)
MESGVAKNQFWIGMRMNWSLINDLALDNQLSRVISNKARKDPKRVVFADAENIKILKVAQLRTMRKE